MTKFNNNYNSKLALARELATLGARAVTITAVARTKPADSRVVHKEVRGFQSQPGRTPTDHEWFLENQTRRIHAAVLLRIYVCYREAYDESPDAHGIAFSIAYRKYVNMCKGKPMVPIERMNLLVTNGFGIGWRSITRGGSSKFSSGNVKVLKCKRCNIPHLAEDYSLTYICPSC